MIFDLIKDFADVLDAMPNDHPRRRILKLLEEAIRRDVHFIDRHPTTFFQCMWNTCWWYDCPEAAGHYEESELQWKATPPWTREDVRISQLLDTWRMEKANSTPGFCWIRSLRPTIVSLGSGQRTVLKGHGNLVVACFSPDGKWIATASADRTVRLWDADSGLEVYKLPPPETLAGGGFPCISFSPDGKHIASGIHDEKRLRIWIADSGTLLTVLDGHEEPITCVQFSPDARLLATGSRDRTIRVWELDTGVAVWTLHGHAQPVNCLCFSPDGRVVVSGAYDKTVRAWSITDGSELHVFGPFPNNIAGVRCSPEERIVIGLVHGSIRIVTLTGMTDNAQAFETVPFLNSIDLSPDGKRVAVGGSGLGVWDISTGEEVTVFTGHESPVVSVAFSSDGSRIVSGSIDRSARVWKLEESWNLPVMELAPVFGVTLLKFLPDGNRLVNVSIDSSCYIWSCERGTKLTQMSGEPGSLRGISQSPDANRIVASGENVIQIWDLNALSMRQIRLEPKELVMCVNWFGDSIHIVSGSANGMVRVWNSNTGEQLLAFQAHEKAVKCVCATVDGQHIASGSVDTTVRIWDSVSGVARMRLDQVLPRGFTTGFEVAGGSTISFSADGLLIAAAFLDNCVRLWNLESGDEQGKLTGHREPINFVDFSPDGRLIFTGSESGVAFRKGVRVWDVESRECVYSIEGTSDTATVSAGLSSSVWLPHVAGMNERETVLKNGLNGPLAGWLPTVLSQIRTQDQGRVFAGADVGPGHNDAYAKHVSLFRVERGIGCE